MNKRKLAKDRRDEIMSVALALSVTHGYTRVTREAVAVLVNVTPQAIQHHIGTMAALRRDLMRRAIECECLPVIAQGMANRDEHALKAPAELLARARAAL
jgi:AcrR family transcriptional regulator